jgi:hypothetical protein
MLQQLCTRHLTAGRPRGAPRDVRAAAFGSFLPRVLMMQQQQQEQAQGAGSDSSAPAKLPRTAVALQTPALPLQHPFRVCTFNVLVSSFLWQFGSCAGRVCGAGRRAHQRLCSAIHTCTRLPTPVAHATTPHTGGRAGTDRRLCQGVRLQGTLSPWLPVSSHRRSTRRNSRRLAAAAQADSVCARGHACAVCRCPSAACSGSTACR